MIADVDCDKHNIRPSQVERIVMAMPWGPPTMMVWSGGGWHVYWCYREPIDAHDDRSFADHHRACAWIRAWINDALGVPAADQMHTRDRILRVPGTHNYKEARRRPDGTFPAIGSDPMVVRAR